MKKVVITGSCGSIGRPMVEQFLISGCEVFGLSLGHYPNSERYTHFVCDIRDPIDVMKTLNAIGPFDVLVNNAGIVEYQPFENTTIEAINKILDTNLKGAINVTYASLPYLNPESIIIFINSMAGVKDLKNMSLYCASKAGLRSFAAVLGEELRGRKIRISSIHPGIVYTDVWKLGLNYPFGDDATQALSPQALANITYMLAMGDPTVEVKNINLFSNVEWW
jgi:NAD(P)-dependent dehydrogenase (short-subunit alcohol dehydrogenase family)